ncbi:radical SAM protein [Magnetospirillum aberrantis]|uniref:Radical SAM protein n=1 Tax=Magnetospirillum aberrantis SpK TaxID=908842 RepID=A0A7C9QWT8_9PROT|nr:radical SAM protein [Magnetospirillum aberrantis]NFV81176.1 radical SAM protein [Magnetospirillum aberrantis SpK]
MSGSPNLFLDGTKLLFHPDRVAAWQRGERIFPLHLDIAPAGACNHRCTFCIVDYKDNRSGVLPGPVLNQLLEESARLGVRSVLFAGDGEPLLNRDLPAAVEVGARAGLSMALNTNAVLLDEKTARRILPHLEWVRISVAAGMADTYSRIHRTKAADFDRVFANIAAASAVKRELGLPVTIGVQQILLPENSHEVVELAERVRDAGADYFVVKRFAEQGLNTFSAPSDLHRCCEDAFRAAEALARPGFAVIIRRQNFEDDGHRDYRRCLGLPFLAYVLADGGVYTCCGFYGEPAFCYGNLHTDSFETIWRSARRAAVTERVETSLDVEKCMKHCRHHNINKVAWELRHPPAHVNFI